MTRSLAKVRICMEIWSVANGLAGWPVIWKERLEDQGWKFGLEAYG